MSDAPTVKDFFGHPLQVGDIAAALIDMTGEDGFLAVVRVLALNAPYARVKLLNEADGIMAAPWSDTAGMVPFSIWSSKLVWHSSAYVGVNDTYVKDILNPGGHHG